MAYTVVDRQPARRPGSISRRIGFSRCDKTWLCDLANGIQSVSSLTELYINS